MITPPSVALSSPAMIDRSVDLPQPECPRMQTNSPSLIRALTSRTATYGPDGVWNTFVNPVISSGTDMLTISPMGELGKKLDYFEANADGGRIVQQLGLASRPRQANVDRRT